MLALFWRAALGLVLDHARRLDRRRLLLLILVSPAAWVGARVILAAWVHAHENALFYAHTRRNRCGGGGAPRRRRRRLLARVVARRAIMTACPRLRRFRPTPWLFNGHLQTVRPLRCVNGASQQRVIRVCVLLRRS